MNLKPLQERLPEGAHVEIVSSGHDWLKAGTQGIIHWSRPDLPTFVTLSPKEYLSVLLVPARDKVKVIDPNPGDDIPRIAQILRKQWR